MRRLGISFAILIMAASIGGAAIGQITGYIQNQTSAVQPGGFSTQTGTVGTLTDTGLPASQCVQTGPGGLLTTTGSNCAAGSGGSGASTLGVNNFGVPITSPTAQINFIGPLTVTAIGSTATVTVSQISLSTAVTGSLPAAQIAAGNLGPSVVASSHAVNSIYPASVIAGTYSNITLPAANIASGYTGSMVIISSAAPASIGVPQLNFTGTPSSPTIARGDGVWASPSSLGLGTITGVIAGTGIAGGGSSGTVTVAVSSVNLTSQVSGILPIANGGNGTATPGILNGSNIIITGAWPNQVINATTSGGGGNGSLVNLSSQYSVPFYSASGSSNTLSGSANFIYNQTTMTVLGPVVASTFTANEYCYSNGTCQTTAGGGGSTNGTINASQNGNIAAYSLPGSSTTLSGSSALQVFTSSVVANQTLYANQGIVTSTITVSTTTISGEIILPDGTVIKSTSTFGGGGTGSPAAPLNAVQFNSTGTFNGSSNFTTDGSSVTVSTAVVKSVASTRIVFAGTNGLLTGSSNLTWDGTSLGVGTGKETLGSANLWAINNSVFAGVSAGSSSGQYQECIGPDACSGNTTNSQIGIGYFANTATSNGPYNIGIGDGSLELATGTGVTEDIGIGLNTLQLLSNPSVGYDIAIGDYSQSNLSTGDENVSSGENTLKNATIAFRKRSDWG